MLITDGRNSITDEITPEQAAEIARNEKIVIHTVGIGSDNPYFQDFHTGRIDKVRDNRMDIDIPQMKRIAKLSKGTFFHAEDRKSFHKIMDKIDAMEKTSYTQPSFIYYKELFEPWLLAGIICLLLAGLLQNTLLQRIP